MRGVSQLVKRATPGEEVLGSIPPPAPYWLNTVTSETEVMVSPLSRVWQHVQLPDASLGTTPRYSLVVDEDVIKKHQPKKQTLAVYIAGSERNFFDCTLRPAIMIWHKISINDQKNQYFRKKICMNKDSIKKKTFGIPNFTVKKSVYTDKISMSGRSALCQKMRSSTVLGDHLSLFRSHCNQVLGGHLTLFRRKK